jgi:hypothetical protein
MSRQNGLRSEAKLVKVGANCHTTEVRSGQTDILTSEVSLGRLGLITTQQMLDLVTTEIRLGHVGVNATQHKLG